MDRSVATTNWKTARTPFNFAGKVVLITGAAGGLGAALAREALARGATVALTDCAADRLEKIANELQTTGRVSSHLAELTDPAAPQQLIQDVIAEHGQLDVLINNAGVSMAGRFIDSNIEQFNAILDINVKAVAALIYAALPHLKPGSHIINISSMSGLVGMPFSTAYSTSKFAQTGLSASLHTELPWSGISVTSVHPGGTDTGLDERLWFSTKASQKDIQDLKASSTKSMKTTSAAKAARLTLNAAQKRQTRLLIGPDTKALDLLSRHAPNSLWKILAKIVNR